MSKISFQLAPETTDANNDGFIMDHEFQPLSMSNDGPDGGVVALVPTDNLVGTDRFLLHSGRGLTFGSGGGSTLF